MTRSRLTNSATREPTIFVPRDDGTSLLLNATLALLGAFRPARPPRHHAINRALELVAHANSTELWAPDATFVGPHNNSASQGLRPSATNDIWAPVVTIDGACHSRPGCNIAVVNVFGRTLCTLLHDFVPNDGGAANVLLHDVRNAGSKLRHRFQMVIIQDAFFRLFLSKFMLVFVLCCSCS